MLKITKKYKWLLLVILIFIMGIGGYLWSNTQKSSINKPIDIHFSYSFHLPDSVLAGDKIEIALPENAPNCQLLVNNSWGSWWLLAENKKFILPDSLMQQAGNMNLSLFYSSKEIASKNIYVKPLASAEPLETYLGAKSILADKEHWAMIVAIPVDKYKNAVAENTKVEYQFHRPNESQETYQEATKHLVSYKKIEAQTKTGKTIVGVKAGNAIGKEKELLEVAGYPTSFSIYAAETYLYADARQYFKLQTSALKDKFGNVVADGTLVSFTIKDTDATLRQLTAYTLNGVAELLVQNPSLAGNLGIVASIYGDVQSNRLTLNFRKSLENFEIQFKKDKKQLIVGPLMGALGQYMPDGAEVEFIFPKAKKSLKAVVNDGYAKLDLADESLKDLTIMIRFGGIEKLFKIE